MNGGGVIRRIPAERLKPRSVSRTLRQSDFDRLVRQRLQSKGYDAAQVTEIAEILYDAAKACAPVGPDAKPVPAVSPPEVGAVMEDGSIYAGISPGAQGSACENPPCGRAGQSMAGCLRLLGQYGRKASQD